MKEFRIKKTRRTKQKKSRLSRQKRRRSKQRRKNTLVAKSTKQDMSVFTKRKLWRKMRIPRRKKMKAQKG